MVGRIRDWIEDLQIWWQEVSYKNSPERLLLARERLSVHKLNMTGKCPFNPYTQPDSDWDRYIPEEG